MASGMRELRVLGVLRVGPKALALRASRRARGERARLCCIGLGFRV